MQTIVILGITVIVGWVILHRSARKSAYWVNSPSLGAIVGVIALAFIVCFILVQAGMFPQ